VGYGAESRGLGEFGFGNSDFGYNGAEDRGQMAGGMGFGAGGRKSEWGSGKMKAGTCSVNPKGGITIGCRFALIFFESIGYLKSSIFNRKSSIVTGW
jgi:hypothetical protein